jgi:hypothetical protein
VLFVLVGRIPSKEKCRIGDVGNSQGVSTEVKLINEQMEREKNNKNRSSPMESDVVFLVMVSVNVHTIIGAIVIDIFL